MIAATAWMPPMDPRASLWCIVRTSPGRTIKLAAWLDEAGIEAWTPVCTIRKRRPRGRAVIKQTAPIMPSFVFVRAVHLRDLEMLIADPASAHPAFSIFRTVDRDGRRLIPLVAEAEVAGARAEEAAALANEERAAAKEHRRVFEPGTRVKVASNAFVGLEAVVEDGRTGKAALVSFGGSIRWSIATYLLTSDELQADLPRAAA